MGPISRLKFYLLALDPGRVGLRLGLRVVLTAAAVSLILFLLGRWVHMPAAGYALGMISAVQGAAQIRDTTAPERAVTGLYAAIAGFVVIAAISYVEHSLLRIDLVLLAVVFLATYARRFGPRWQAVGMFTFMCGVVGAFLKAPEADLKEIAIALAISGMTAHIIRTFVVPDAVSRDFRRVVNATLSISQDLQRTISAAGGSSGFGGGKDLFMKVGRLRNAILMCESYLPLQAQGEDAELASGIALRLLDLQLAAEMAMEACSESGAKRSSSAAGDSQHALANFRESGEALQAAVRELPESFPKSPGAGSPTPSPGLLPKRGEWLKDEALRLSLQVTLACALAMAGGELLSSERWFWAVMAAFLIFMNTQSSGAVAIRGVSRSLGTALGIAAGIALATVTHGSPNWAIPLIGISMFMAFYLMYISYTGMTLFITITISLIYGLIGIFTPELLLLRLEETAVGAAAGILVALIVLPVSPARRARQARNKLINAVIGLIDLVIDPATPKSAEPVAVAVSTVDKAYADVRKALEPMRMAWTFGGTDVRIAETLRQAYLMAHAAHLLEHSVRDAAPNSNEAQVLRLIRDRLQVMSDGGPTAEDAAGTERSGADADDTSVRYGVKLLWGLLPYLQSGNAVDQHEPCASELPSAS